MGYGARQGVATGVHDPIWARAIAITPESEESRGVLVVSADLCLITPEQAGAVRQSLAEATGLTRSAILLACTHTHSAPDTGLGEVRTGRPLPPLVPELMAGIEHAGREAWEARAPARASWHRAAARVGRNRRIADTMSAILQHRRH